MKKFNTICLLASILFLVLFNAGCTAAWLSGISALLPSILALATAVFDFLKALKSGLVPANALARVQEIVGDIGTEINNAQEAIAAYTQATVTDVIGKLNVVFQNILTNLQSILGGLNITDSATLAKVTSLIGLAVAAAQAVLGMIPIVNSVVANASKYSEHDLKALDAQASDHFKNFHKGIRDAYHDWVTTPTLSPDVNIVLEGMPKQLP
jgi:uncharacterized membrane protein